MPTKIVASIALALLTLSFAHADTKDLVDQTRHQQRPPVVDPPPSGTPTPKPAPTPPKFETPTKPLPTQIKTDPPLLQTKPLPRTIVTKPASSTLQTPASSTSAIETSTKPISKSIELSKEPAQKQP